MLMYEITNFFSNHDSMFSKNKKIFHLLFSTNIFYLCRKSVSTFLTSGMRDEIDQIMNSRTQAKPNLIVNRTEHQLEDVKKGYEHVMASKMIEEEENKSPVGHNEAAECFEQTPQSTCSLSPSVQYRSWARNPVHSLTDESVSSPSLEQSPTSNSYIRDNKPSLVCLSFNVNLLYGTPKNIVKVNS